MPSCADLSWPGFPRLLAPPADNLLSGFSLPQTRYYHDVSVDSLLHLSVVRAGAAIDMNLDCHRAGEHKSRHRGFLHLAGGTLDPGL